MTELCITYIFQDSVHNNEPILGYTNSGIHCDLSDNNSLYFVHPLNARQLLVIYIFDFVVVIFLAIDFCIRLRASPQKLRYVLSHFYEFPAMLPLALFGFLDTFVVTNNPILSFKLIALFRLVRLFNLVRYIRGNEIFLLTGIAAVTIIFGAVGTYFAESQNPNANITTLDNAFWYAIETITTVAYGEYYPVTQLGRVISMLLMFCGNRNIVDSSWLGWIQNHSKKDQGDSGRPSRRDKDSNKEKNR